MTTTALLRSSAPSEPLARWRVLAPLSGVVFAEFLAIGLPLPVLSAHVEDRLGLGAFVVGLVIGAQSWATLLTRSLAGARTDARGPRGAATLGLGISTLAALVLSLAASASSTAASVALLLVSRALLGLGESFVVTAALGWGVALLGRERSGLVMAWVGIAMYAALACGSPLGTALEPRVGLGGVALVAALAPLVGLFGVAATRATLPTGGRRLPARAVAARVALPGAGLSLAALGFGAIVAYTSLRFEARGWAGAGLATSAFGAAYVLVRVLFGTLPDRLGGARVAAGSAALVGLGQLAAFFAPTGPAAIAAAALTGLGFSLAFPSFGIEAIRRVPPESRGAALGVYAASFDLAMGVGVPVLGVLVGAVGYDAAHLAAALAALGSLLVAAHLGTLRSAS